LWRSLSPNQYIIDTLQSLEHLHHGSDEARRLQEVSNAYLDTLIADAGLIGEEQIQYFIKVMSYFRDVLNTHYDRLTKIAILHHHIGHIWEQDLELKSFEAIVDAAQLKTALIANDFDFVLHGHKHINYVGLDASLIPISENRALNPLCIVSGGTVGGYPRLNDKQTFKLLQLDGNNGPRKRPPW